MFTKTRLCAILWYLFFIFQTVLGGPKSKDEDIKVTEDKRLPMVRWGNDDKFPTWHARTSFKDIQDAFPELDLKSDPKSPVLTVQNPVQAVQAVANLHFNWLSHTLQSASVLPEFFTNRNKNGALVVAVMYDSVHHEFWASTIPKGERASQMLAALNTDDGRKGVRLWYSYAWQYATPPTPEQTRYHAEDGVYFNWESAYGVAEDAKQYPRSSIDGRLFAIAAYGMPDGYDGPKSFDGAKKVPLCFFTTTKNPTCRQVAKALGVGHQHWNSYVAPIPPNPNPGKITGVIPESSKRKLSDSLEEMCEQQGKKPNLGDKALQQRNRFPLKQRASTDRFPQACKLEYPTAKFEKPVKSSASSSHRTSQLATTTTSASVVIKSSTSSSHRTSQISTTTKSTLVVIKSSASSSHRTSQMATTTKAASVVKTSPPA